MDTGAMEGLGFSMETEYSTALDTLKSDPANPSALEVLTKLHPGNGTGLDRDQLGAILAQARAWHEERGDVVLCVQLIDIELGWTPSGSARAELLTQKARLLHNELVHTADARTCLAEAMEATPGHRSAIDLQKAIETEEADWQDVAKAKLHQAKAAGDRPAGAPAWAVAGELFLKFRPKSKEGEAFLRRALELDPRQKRADVLLERLLREAGRIEDLVEVYDRRIGIAGNSDERAAAESLAGTLAEQLGRPERAFEHFRMALAASPSEPRALHWMVRTLGASEKWADLAKVYDNALRTTKRGPAEIPLLLPLANLLWKRLGQIDQAELYYRRIKKVLPVHPEVIDFYRDYHTSRNEIPQLLAHLAQAQKGENDSDKRIRIGIEMAELAEQRPQSLEKAIDAWKALLRLRPGLPEAVSALRRLYTKTEKWNALLELLKDDLEALPATAVDEKVARYLEMIPIYRDRLRLEVMVINTYVAILSLRPDHPDALAALAERYEAQGRWGDLVSIFTRQAEATADTSLKVALFHRVAALWAEKFNKHQNAVAALEKILQIAPADEKARASLKDIYTRSRSWRALIDLMRREATLLEGDRKRAHIGEMARLAAERLSDLRQAIGLWNDALLTSPDDPDALASLAALYDREKRWPSLAEILARQAAVAGAKTPAWCALLERRGVLLHEKLGASQAALEDLRQVQAVAPENARVARVLREIYSDLGQFDSLEALYVARGAFDELCEVLSGIADRTNDVLARTRLLERVADLAQTKLQQPERALKAYEKILATDPDNRAAARAAAGLYRATERWGRLLATYEILLGPAPGADGARPSGLSPEETLQILAESRRICETKLNSKSLAFQWCARAYELAPTDPAVFADLERLAEEADEWEATATLFAKRLAAQPAPETEERLGLLRRSMRIAVARLNKPADARRLAEELLQLKPEDDEAETALQQIFTRTESWSELVVLLLRRQGRALDGAARVDMLFRIARIQEEKVGDRAAAAKSYAEVIELDPRNLRALRALGRALEAERDWPRLADVLRRQVDLCPDDERAGILLNLGRLEEKTLDNPSAAVAAYLRALEADSINGEAVAGIERLVDANQVPRDEIANVCTRLAPYYELTENYQKWARALETLAELAATDAERMPHLEMLTHLYGGPLADPPSAYKAAVRMFQIEPENFIHRERLLQVATDAGALDELVSAVRAVLAATDNQDLRRDLLAYIAEVEERRPGRGGEAESAYKEILTLDPQHFAAFRSLTRMYRDAERWTDLRDLLTIRQEGLAETKDRIELLSQIAEIDEAVLDDRDHAISTLRQLLSLQKNDLRYIRSLERHYTAAERWKDLDDLLAREIPLVPSMDATDLKLRRAEVAFLRFNDAPGALNLLEQVLYDDPDHVGARSLLERILEVPAERQKAAVMLEPLYEAAGNWPRLVSVLQIQREAREGLSAVELLTRIAEVQENKLQSRQAALATWRQILEVDPYSTRALSEFERLATVLERFNELVELYQLLAEKRDTGDVSGPADLLGRAARLYMARFSDRASAIRVWRQVLDLDTTNTQTAAPAADALEALYVETGDFRGLVDVLRAKVEWTHDRAERTALLLRIAALEEKSLGDGPAAVTTYRTLLETDGDNNEALNNLERIFEGTGQHRERVDILNRRVGASDPNARRELRFRIAAILERELNDPDEAISAVLAILDESADDRTALDALARLYDKKGATAERLEILERRLALATNSGDRVELLRQIAEILQGPLGRPGEAFDRWREILQLAPRDPGALAQLERLLGEEESALRILAAQAIEPIYEQAGEWDKLARVLNIYIDAADDPHERMVNRVRLAELQDRRLNDRVAAFASYGSAIKDALGDAGLPNLLDAYERLGGAIGPERVDEVASLYRSVEPDVLNDDVRGRLQRAIASHAQARGEGTLASTYYRKILDRTPDDLGVLASLEALYRDAKDGAALYDVLLRRAELSGNNVAAELPLRLQAGALALELGRTDEAVAAYERVWALRPGEPEALKALDNLYTQGSQWSDLANLLERRLSSGMTEREGVGIHFRLAGIELSELKRRDRALEHLAAVLRGEPDHAEAIKLLEELLQDAEAQVDAANLLEPVYVRRNAWSQLVAIDKIRLEHTEDPAQRLTWTERIAQIYEEQIEDLDEAFRWFGRVFQEQPTDRASQEQLVRLARRLGRWQDVSRLLGEYLEGEMSNSDEVLQVVRLAASIHDEELGDHDTARKYYRRFIDAQPTNRAASEVFERALERWEAWRELRDLLEEQSTRLDSTDDRIMLLRRSAKISEERLESRADAIGTLKSILDLDAGDPRASAELERLLRAEERWSDLRDHLIWALDREAETFAQDTVAMKLAEIEQQRLENTAAAVDRYGEILARTPAHPGALAALEGLINDQDQRHRIAELLEPLYRQAHDRRKLVEALEIQLEAMDDPRRRTDVWREIAGLEESLGRLDRALEARGKAWLEDVEAKETLADLENLAAQTKRFARLVQILQEGTEAAGDPDLRASLCALRAKTLETRLGDPAQAVEAWREALAARSDDVEAFLALERLLAAAGRSAELCDTLEKHVEIVTDVAERKALTKRMAVLFEQALKQRDKAVSAWRSVMELDDADEEALDALARLYAAGNSWSSLAEIYQRKIELAEDPQSLRLLRFLSARLHDEKLEEPFEAASQLRAVLDAHPGDPEALELLDRIFTREGQHAELLEILDLRAMAERNAAEKEGFAFRAARLLEQDLSDVQGAVERYRDILSRSSRHPGAREALWALARGEEHRLLAVPVLEPVLRTEKEWGPLVELLELRLQGEDALGPRLEILAEIAAIEEREQNEPENAFSAWARAFAEDPTEGQAREALERLATAQGTHVQLAKVYEERLRASFDPELQRSLAGRLAELNENQLNDTVRAVEYWREVRDLPGDEAPVLARLETLLRKLNRDSELEEVLNREAELASEPSAQADFWAALGDVRGKRLGNIDDAIDAYRAALDRNPSHPGALAALRGLLGGRDLRPSVLDILEPLAETRGDFAELLVLYEARLGLEDEHAEKAMWLRRIAELAEQKLNDLPKALDALGRGLREDPLSFQTADEVERVARNAKLDAEGAKRIEAVLDALEDGALAEMALRAARLYEEAQPATPEHEAAAERLYNRALEVESESGPALVALEALYRRRKDGVQLAKVLERRGGMELDPDRRTALYGEAAKLHEERGDVTAALAAWRSVRESDEGNLGALAELARLLEREKKLPELVQVLEDEARFLDEAGPRAAVYVRIGELKAGPLNDLDGAAAAFREALDVAPEDQAALSALATVEERRGDFQALEEALLRRLTATKGDDQVAVLFKLAENASKQLDDSERALSYLHQVLDADPKNRGAYGEIERILTAQERWHDLIDLLERRADLEAKSGDGNAELAARAAVAEIWANRLGSPESALETLETILARDPKHVPSLLALARIHEAAESWSDARSALERAAKLAAAGKETAEINYRVGRILAAESGPAEEVEARYLAALEADATHTGALEALENLARTAGNFGQLVQILELRERLEKDETKRKSLLSEIGNLYTGLGQPAEAIGPLQRLSEMSAGDLTVQENLGKALVASGRVDEGERILTALVDQMTRGRQNKNVARLQQVLGTLAEGRGDLNLAEQRLAAAYQLDPTHAATLAALARIAARRNDPEKARRYYRSLLLQNFDEKSVGVSKAEVYYALGKLHQQAGELPKARNMFERGLELDPQNAAYKQALAELPK
jgi:tetratricopeptide (TPR) repeat protein